MVGAAHKATGTETANVETGKAAQAALVAPAALDQVTVPDLKADGDQVLTGIQEEGKIRRVPRVCTVLKAHKVAGIPVLVNTEEQDLPMVLGWANTVELPPDMDPGVQVMDHQVMVLQVQVDLVLPDGAALRDLQVDLVPAVSLEEGNPADMVPVE